MSGPDPNFEARRQQARESMHEIDAGAGGDPVERDGFFNAVYERAAGDPAAVPWADLAPKPQLVEWLAENSGCVSSTGLPALDIACGLGDNAEAMAAAGFRTHAFDLAADAIDWAKKRFPESTVDYRVADLFDPPAEWNSAFGLVHECFTLQALPPDILEKTAAAISRFVAPSGRLLVYTRTRPDGASVDGPPWPLEEARLDIFADHGFEKESETRFTVERGERIIPHAFIVWRRP